MCDYLRSTISAEKSACRKPSFTSGTSLQTCSPSSALFPSPRFLALHSGTIRRSHLAKESARLLEYEGMGWKYEESDPILATSKLNEMGMCPRRSAARPHAAG